jgi:hypothetical protein
VGVAAAEAVAASIRRGVREAESLGGAPSVSDWATRNAEAGSGGARG